LKEAFRLYDKEGNGFIPTSCLKEILRELDDQLSDADLDGMIQEIDSDGSGTVDFDGEFACHLIDSDFKILPHCSFFLPSLNQVERKVT
jgi:Ca2+-binding EF-hand superfamily protein